MCTIADDCAQVAESGLEPPFESPPFGLSPGSRFAAIRIATGAQRFQIARFASQGQKPFESLLRLYYFSRALIRERHLESRGP